jgi:hypothetical protein
MRLDKSHVLKIFLVFAYYLLRDSGIKQKPSYIRVSRTYSHVKDFPKTGKSHPVFVWTGTIARRRGKFRLHSSQGQTAYDSKPYNPGERVSVIRAC